MKIALLGKTGVGKSTLINAVVGAPVAATGVGLPVTRKPATYSFRDGHALYDGAGIGLGSSVPDLIDAAKRTLKDADVARWCVRASDWRFEKSEATVIQAIISAGIPLDVVITQTPLVGGGDGRKLSTSWSTRSCIWAFLSSTNLYQSWRVRTAA